MPPRTEVLGNGAVGGEKPLCVTRGLEPLPASLPLASRLVRVLRPVIEVAVLVMFYPWEQLSLSCPVALQFVGDDDPRYVGQSLEQLAEELLRGALIPPTLDQDIEDVPVLIYCPPPIMPLAFDGQQHLIHMPLVPGPGASPPELIGILLPELAAPFADRLVGHDDSAFKQQLFDITKTQAEPNVQPHGMADNVGRKGDYSIVTEDQTG